MENHPSVEILLRVIADYQETLDTVLDNLDRIVSENGMEDNPVNPDAKFRKTIMHLRNQVERQDRWLEDRKREVSDLQNSIRYERDRKAHYKKQVDDLSRRHMAKESDYDKLADVVADYADGKKSWVFVLDALSKVRRRDFEIDTEDGEPYEIPGS